jgi:hypothetical protein
MSETVTANKRAYTRTLKTYVVSQTGEEDRLVRAYSSLEAIKHCMPVLGVHLATQDDIIALMSGGVPVETTVAASRVPGVDDDGMPAGLTD